MKKIWIMNHYAISMLANNGGRHLWIAEQLVRDGYEPIIFGCNTKVDSNEVFFPSSDMWHEEMSESGIKFVVINSSAYKGNGMSRVKNMIIFANNLKKTAKEYASIHGKPDLIYASSVHPLTVIAGETIAKKMKIPCIGEVRDLWPETLVAYGALKRRSIFANILYKGEYWMYKRADAMIFTMEGAKDYIVEHKWDSEHGGCINLDRVYNVNNGVDIEQFDKNVKLYDYADPDLDDANTFCCVYTGSIRRANNLGLLIDAFEHLKDIPNLKILVWGKGNELEMLQKRVETSGLSERFIFKGFVEKKYIPSILCKSSCNLMHWERTSVNNYGYDYNKLFEYLAAGKPIFSTIQSGHSLLVNKKCGIETKGRDSEQIAAGIRSIYNMDEKEYNYWSTRAREVSFDYDFKKQTLILEDAIDGLLNNR